MGLLQGKQYYCLMHTIGFLFKDIFNKVIYLLVHSTIFHKTDAAILRKPLNKYCYMYQIENNNTKK